jgi:hypothetical protein
MPMPLRVSRALVRSLGPGLLLAIAFLLAPQPMLGQHVTGLNIIKNCPLFVAPSTAFNCTYSLQNQDTAHGVAGLAVTNQVPDPGGPILPIPCTQGGSPVTSLGANGTVTDTCIGTIPEVSPACGSTDAQFIDTINATGTDAGIPALTVSGTTQNGPVIPACTPTPTPTATSTPTPTGTIPPTATNTPTNTNTPSTAPPPTVPTLSFPMMALLGLILAGAGIFLARRQ